MFELTHFATKPSKVLRVILVYEYICSNLSEKLTISGIAAHFQISPTTLKEEFRARYGLPISSCIRNMRIQNAIQLLTQTDKSVIEIANTCGYENPSKFSSAFRKLTGSSPSAYREAHRFP